ncbi:MAG: hypothetical protein ACOC1K_04830 [Nanoarchaeota archaeon]
MKLKYFIFIALFFALVSGVSAKECGGNITCECGDLIKGSYTMQEDLFCEGDALKIDKRVMDFDCNGYEIFGNGSGVGIEISAYSQYVNIFNCKISNFNVGIQDGLYKYSFVPCDSGNCIVKGNYKYNSFFHEIYDNILYNNSIGIEIKKTVDFKTYNNTFINNSDKGFYFSGGRGKVWNNDFYGTGLIQNSLAGKQYCVNGVGNNYLGGAEGLECGNCIRAYSWLTHLNDNVKFCTDEYEGLNFIVPSSLKEIDCQGSIFIGDGSGSALFFKPGAHNIVKNCSFINYSIAFRFQGTPYNSCGFGGCVTRYNYPRGNKFYNITYFDVDYGFYYNSYRGGESIVRDSNLIADKYNFYRFREGKYNDARNNWWGTNDSSKISSKILQSYVGFVPFKTEGPKPDLYLDSKDIAVIGNKIILNIENRGDFYTTGFKVKIFDIQNGKYLNESEFTLSEGIHSGFKTKYVINWTRQGDSIGVLLDSREEISEISEVNNFALLGEIKPLTYTLDINLNNKLAEEEIKEFLRNNFGRDYEVEEGDFTIRMNQNLPNLILKDIFFNFSSLNFFNNSYERKFEKPYESLIIANTSEVYVFSNNTEGFIIGAKELVKNYEDYIVLNNFKHIGSLNLEGIKVYDYLKEVGLNHDSIRLALNDEMYDISEDFIPVSYNDGNESGSINYRYRKLNSLKSPILKSFIDKDGYPVVMSGGLWSDIETWNELGTELANEGYNVYLIEMTGGKNSECDTCYNYPYEHLTDNVLPSYVNHFLTESGKSKIKYVGHSNGGRVMLDSLTSGQINEDVVDTYVGAGVPGAFEELSNLPLSIKLSGDIAINRFSKKNKTYISLYDVGTNLKELPANILSLIFLFEDRKISLNLFEKYFYFINSSEDIQPGKNINLDYFSLLYGDSLLAIDNDLLVPIEDELIIFNNIQSENKFKKEFGVWHIGMSEHSPMKDYVRQSLNKGVYKE